MAGVGSPLATAFVRVRPDTKGFGRELKSSVEREGNSAGQSLSAALSKGTAKIDVRQLDTLAQKIRDIRTLSSATIKPIKEFGQQVARMAVTAGAASTALLAGTGLAGGLLAVAGALAQVAGAAPVAAAGILSVVGILGTVKVATLGVSDAFGEVVTAQSKLAVGAKLSKKDIADLDESLKALAPSARKVVLAFADILPELRKIQQAVQQRFFANMAKDLQALAARYLPGVSTAAQRLAQVLNQTVRGAVAGLLTSTVQWNLLSVLEQARRQLGTLAPILSQIPALFVNIAAAAAPALTALSTDLARVLSGFLDRLRGAVDSGGLGEALNAGIAAIKNLGAVIHNVFAIISGVVNAASRALGTDLLAAVRNVTGGLATLVNSAPGQDFLRGLFATALPVLKQVGAILKATAPLLAGLVPVVVELASAFLEALAPVIPVAVELARTLGGALAAVLPAVSQLAVAIGGALTLALNTLAPIIPPLATAVANLLGPFGVVQALLEAIAPVLPVLVDGFAAVLGILAGGLIQVIRQLAPVLPKLVAAFVALATVIASSLADALVELAPLLPLLVSAFADFVNVLSGALLQALHAIIPVLPVLIRAVMDLLVAFTPLIPVIVQLIPPMVQLAVAVIPPLVRIIVALAPLIIVSVQAFVLFQTVLLKLGATILGPVLSALAWLVEGVAKIVGAIISGVTRFVGAVPAGLSKVVSFFTALPGRVLSALGGWRGLLVTIATGALGGLARGVLVGIGLVVSHFTGLPGKVRSTLGGWAGSLRSVAGSALAALVQGVVLGIGKVIGYFRGMLGRIVGAVGDLGGALFGAGKAVIQGLINGIQAAWGALKSTLAATGGLIPAWKGPMSKDRRLLVPTGRAIMGGLIGGIEDSRVDLRRTLASITGQIANTGGTTGQYTAAAAGGVTVEGLRSALSGMAIRFDGDGLARLVSARQSYAAAAGGRR